MTPRPCGENIKKIPVHYMEKIQMDPGQRRNIFSIEQLGPL